MTRHQGVSAPMSSSAKSVEDNLYLHGIQYGNSLGWSGYKDGDIVNLHVRHMTRIDSKHSATLIKTQLSKLEVSWMRKPSGAVAVELAAKDIIAKRLCSAPAKNQETESDMRSV